MTACISTFALVIAIVWAACAGALTVAYLIRRDLKKMGKR